MNPWQDVADFHRVVCKRGVPERIGLQNPDLADLRARLITEEAEETAEAIELYDIEETLDGLIDLLYVTYGALIDFGITEDDLSHLWREVHESNMEKANGPIREDGKAEKPADWQPPDIGGVLIGINLRRDVERARLAIQERDVAT